MSLLLLLNPPLYHRSLLDAADQFLSQEPAVALVTAHMACEILVEQLMSTAFKTRGIADLEEAVTDFFSGSSMGNNRIRKLFVALTGDAIQKAPFWERFDKSSTLRNKAIHEGKRVSPDEGREACAVAREFVAHLEALAKTLSGSP
jgi:hypothetical protein